MNIFKGIISVVRADSLDVIIPALDAVVPNVSSLDTYTDPAVNDTVVVVRSGTSYLVLGKLRGA